MAARMSERQAFKVAVHQQDYVHSQIIIIIGKSTIWSLHQVLWK